MQATCVALGEVGFLIQGPSGSGKSGLALQMIALGAALVADDGVILTRQGDAVHATAHPRLRGGIEARGLGLLTVAHRDHVALHHCIDLGQAPEGRLPQTRFVELFDIKVPLILGQGVPSLAAGLIVLGKGARWDGPR